MNRLIAHVDMDAFYASVEILDNPELSGRPVVVGGSSNRGVVSAASYAARKFGIHSAMPIFEAKRLCPELIALPVRMVRYKEVSRAVMALLRDFAPAVQQLSVDEAFLDLTGTTTIYGRPRNAGLRVKQLIRSETGLTCSVGMGPNKLIAKIASDYDKPDGLVVVPEDEAADFVGPLSVRKLPGVGPRMAEKMKTVGVERVVDLRRFTIEELTRIFGSMGPRLAEISMGQDESPLAERERPKSISAELTLEADTADPRALDHILGNQALRIGRQIRAQGLLAKTVTLKLKHSDFRQVTRSTTLDRPTDETRVILRAGLELLAEYELKVAVRLVGLGLSNLIEPSQVQADLFTFREGPGSDHPEIDRAVDKIMEKFGPKAIKLGLSLKK